MSTIAAIVLGLLIGWLIEWVIDWVYWRRRGEGIQDSVDDCQQARAALQADLDTSRKDFQTLQGKVSQLDQERLSFQAELNASRDSYQSLQEKVGLFDQERAALQAELDSSRAAAQSLQEKIGQLEMENARLEALSAQAGQEFAAARARPVMPETPVLPETPPVPDNLEEINGIGVVIARRLNENGIYTFEQLAAQTPQQLRAMLGDVIQRLADEESWIEQARRFAQRKQSRGAGVQ